LFDLIIAADVFPYVGDLAQTLEACRRHLKAGGLFAFSIESVEGGPDYILRATNRYAHSSGYVRQLAQRNGFVEAVCEEVMVRKNKGEPVGGYIFVLRRES
jgi:predicted TPR repeat methyltransferase